MLWQHVKVIDWEKNTEVLVEIMIELKNLFKKLQAVANNVLFREETINDKVLKKLKKSKYNKDIEFVNLLKSNIDFLGNEKNLSQ